MMQRMLAAILICGSSLILSCTADYGDNPIQPELEEYKGIPLVIFDTDIGSSTDDLSPLTGVELVRKKVKCLYLMAGVFTSSDEPDYNFLQDSTFAQLFFELWLREVDVVFSPMEVGNEIEYIPETVISDINWTDILPIKQIYMNYDCDTGQRMWDPLTVIHAVEGDAEFLLSERGIVTLTPKNVTIFTPSATGNFRYQKPGSKAWYDEKLEIIRTYNRMK